MKKVLLQTSFTNVNTVTRFTNVSTANGAMAKWLRRWTPSPGVPCSKPLGGSKVDSVFHLSQVDKMSTGNFWELSGKK